MAQEPEKINFEMFSHSRKRAHNNDPKGILSQDITTKEFRLKCQNIAI